MAWRQAFARTPKEGSTPVDADESHDGSSGGGGGDVVHAGKVSKDRDQTVAIDVNGKACLVEGGLHDFPAGVISFFNPVDQSLPKKKPDSKPVRSPALALRQ